MSPDPLDRLEHSYADAVPALSLTWSAAAAPDPRVVVVNDDLAQELGLDPDWLRSPDGVALLSGQVPTTTRTVAQAYAGHQFGGYSPRLGDGRALLLGEIVDAHGRRRDLHLKGSGRTPFARGGDGSAALGPMLREYLMGEAMHALAVPTTRALAVLSTGAVVQRETTLPGAVLCRVADSHLRVGTFQFAAATGDRAVLRSLADYAIARHHPDLTQAANPYLEFFARVVRAQADLVAEWMRVGFIHGVMNTDNMTICGQTIDYGPCAFLDAYDPATVFSSIDHAGRYAYENQPAMAQWNLARLGETLLPLIDADPDAAVAAATDTLAGFAQAYNAAAAAAMSRKVGLVTPHPELIGDLLHLMAAQRVDFTGFFRALADGTAESLFADPAPVRDWLSRRAALLPGGIADTAAMNRVNPLYIPRNHQVEQALAAATDSDLGPFTRLSRALRDPFTEQPGCADLAGPAPVDAPAHVTFCGT